MSKLKSVVEDGQYVAVAPDGTEIESGYKKEKRFVEIQKYADTHQVYGEYRIKQPEVKVLIAASDPLVIVPPNEPPEWLSTPIPSFQQGVGGTYNLAPLTNDPEGDTKTFSLDPSSNPWPAGWQMDSAGLITVSTLALAGTTTGMKVRVSDGENSPVTSPTFSCVVTSAATGKKWNPGHYIKPQGDPFDGTTQSAFLSAMSSQLSNQAEQIPEFKGIMFPCPWGWLNPNGSTMDLNFLTQMSNQAKSQNKQWSVLVHYKSFLWLNNKPPDPLDPKTVEAPSDLIASKVAQHNQGYIAHLWEPAVMDRFIDCLEAIAAAFDDDPSFESILLPEAVPSFGGIGSPAGYDIDEYALELQRCYEAMAAAFTRTNVIPQINSLSNQVTELFEKAFDLRIGIGAPDSRETPGWSFFAGGNTNPEDPQDGEQAPRDYRGQLARAGTISTSTFGKTGRTEPQVITFMQEQKVTHYQWITSNGKGYTWTGIKNAIQANPTVHTACPTRYLACDTGGGPPPSGERITAINFNLATIRNTAPGNGASAPETDNWPICHASDGNQYTSFGDGYGFGNLAGNTLTRASIGFSRISGGKDNYSAQDMSKHGKNMPDSFTGKCQGMFAANSKIYCSWDYRVLESVDPGGGSRADAYFASTICKSEDWGATWTEIIRWNNSDWGGASPPDTNGFFAPTFLQFGQDNAGARDNYVYLYLMEHDNGDYEVQTPGGISLARCLLSNLESGNKAHWEYLTSIDGSNNPTWSTTLANRALIFQDTTDGNHVTQVCYNAPLGRYILTTLQGERGNTNQLFGCYDAPEPWGPWTLVRKEDAGNLGIGTGNASILWGFSNKWLSADGLNFVMVGTLPGQDQWGTVEGTFTFG